MFFRFKYPAISA